jgi:sec-independent protein translocase protein TatB
MLSFGWSEIALVVVIIIIVVGPKEIPNLLKQLGSFSKSLRKTSRQFKNSLNDLAEEGDLKDLKNSISDISDLKKSIDPTNELKKEIKSIKEIAKFTDKEISDINTKVLKD